MAMKRDDAKTSHMALLIIHPFQEDSNLIERESRDKSTGEIDMDFVRATRRIRAEFSRSMYSIRLDPGQGIASESSFGPAPVSTEDFHSLLGIAGQDRKRQPINRESECRLHGTYRTPVKNPVVRAPVLPPCYQDGGCSGPRPSLSALGADRHRLLIVRRRALFSASFLCRSCELLPHHGKRLLTDFTFYYSQS